MRTIFTKLLVTVFCLWGANGAFAQLSGSYTIDANGSGTNNYTSVVAAENALNSSGVSGACTFTIEDGTYSGYVDFNKAISGASATNTITFISKSKDASKVTLRGTGTYNMRLNNTDYMRFEHLTFYHNRSSGYNVYINNNANYNEFKNCVFEAVTSRSLYNIYLYRSDYTLFDNCRIDGGYYAMRMWGWNTTNGHHTTITNSTIVNAIYYGIYSYYSEDFKMTNCYMDSSQYSFLHRYGTRSELRNNKIFGGYFYFAYENYYSNSKAKDSSYITNNMIYSKQVTSYGWYGYRMRRTVVNHNSMEFNGSSYGVYFYQPRDCKFLNNNWKNSGGTYGAYIYFGTADAPDAFDYNNLDWSGSNFAYFGTGVRGTFANLVSAYTQFNKNTINKPVQFEGARNFRSYAVDFNNKGKKTQLNKDIDGNNRPATGDTKVDIGCNDFYLSPYDLDIAGVVNPVSLKIGNNDVTLGLRNKGSGTLTNQYITLAYSVDTGKTWTSENDTITSLAPGGSYNFTFSQAWSIASAGSYDIMVRISKQVTNDPDTKDEMNVSLCTGLAGRYTVGRPNSDFPTLTAALAKLACGLAGNTTFELQGGNGGTQATYGQIKFQGVNGNPNASLTIDGKHTDSVKVSRTANSFEGAIDLNNCHYLKFTNMTIEHGNSTGAGVHIHSGSTHNTIEDCIIKTTSNSTYYQNVGVAFTGSTYRTTTDADNNLIKNNTITGQYYGINAYSARNGQSGNVFEGNTITNYYYYGMYYYYQYDVTVDGNTVVNPRYQYNYPWYHYYCGKSEVKNNEIGDYYVYGIYMYRENYYSQSDTSLMKNNIFGGTCTYTSATYGYGPRIYYAYNLQVRHNTFVYDANTPSTGATGNNRGAGLKVYYSYNFDLQNNIFQSNHNSGGTVPFASVGVYSWAAMEGNNFVHPGGILASINGSNVSTVAALQSSIANLNNRAYSEPVYFDGSSYRLSTTKRNLRGVNIGITDDIDGDSRCLFAPSIGADESGFPEPKTRAFFAVPDTVGINSMISFSNQAKTSDPLIHDWYVDGQYVGSAVDLEYKFKATGSYTVKLESEGCGGKDDYTKTVVVIIPKNAPKAQFIASTRVIDVNDAVDFKNLTTGWADSFHWEVDSYWVTGQFGFKIKSHDFINGTDSSSLNPTIEFTSPGTYTISLEAYNLRGSDTARKTAHIVVRTTATFCGVFDESTLINGKLFDEGGPSGGYVRNRRCNFLLDPCTDRIEINIKQFDLAAASYLRIYDGKDNTGKPLHDYDPTFSRGLTGKMSASGFKTTFVATSGEMYFEFESGNATAAGFEIEWKANQVSPSSPIVDFDLADTVCAKTPVYIPNKSTGLDADYEWTMDTTAASWFNGADYDDEDGVTHMYDSAGTYQVKVVARNCGGVDSLVKSIVVVAPTAAPTPGFAISNSRPAIGDAVTLTDESILGNYPCISSWEWTISPSTYSFVTGFDKNSKNPQVLLSDTGCYSVTLVVGNSFGTASTTEVCGMYSISTCIPNVKIPNTDIGISRVVVGDIDNSSDINENGYESFVSSASTELEVGASYDVTIERPAGRISNDMNRAVWIDYNQDGDFSPTELVASSKGDLNQTWTGSISIPTTALKGSSRMRVGVNLGNFKQYGCGPNQFGEFEDYRVFIIDDSKAPEIIFVGSQTITVEQCSNWTDPGAYGWDNVDDSVALTSTVSGVDLSKAGTYTIVYKAEDKTGNEGQGTRTVIVETDYTDPVLTLKGSNPVTLEVKSTFTDDGADASDNCGGNISADVTTTGTVDANILGTYYIDYEVADAAGNTVTDRREVIVVDTQVPTLVLNGNSVDTVEVLTSFTDLGATGTDNYYPEAELTYTVTGTVDVSTVGTYELKYTATDGSGNVSSEITRTVVVADRTAPVIRIADADETLILDVNVDTYDAEDIFVTENYTSVSVVEATLAVTGTYATTFGIGATPNELGDFTAIYTVMDEAGNVGTITRNIQVVDRVAPTLTFNDGQVIVIPRWGSYTDTDVTPADNYYQASEITVTTTGSFDKNSVGTYQIEYCAEDPSGNKFCAIRTIVVAETDQTIGVDEVEIEASIYPNPTTGVLNIEVDLLNPGRTKVSIMNALGQEVMNVTEQTGNRIQHTADLSTLGSGVYFVRIVSGNHQLVKRVTVSE